MINNLQVFNKHLSKQNLAGKVVFCKTYIELYAFDNVDKKEKIIFKKINYNEFDFNRYTTILCFY